MQIRTNYPVPVTINGFACRNCAEASLAERHIDPAHPEKGRFGIGDKAFRRDRWFAPVAREAGQRERLHGEAAAIARGSAVARAYGAGSVPAPGTLVDVRA